MDQQKKKNVHLELTQLGMGNVLSSFRDQHCCKHGGSCDPLDGGLTTRGCRNFVNGICETKKLFKWPPKGMKTKHIMIAKVHSQDPKPECSASVSGNKLFWFCPKCDANGNLKDFFPESVPTMFSLWKNLLKFNLLVSMSWDPTDESIVRWMHRNDWTSGQCLFHESPGNEVTGNKVTNQTSH